MSRWILAVLSALALAVLPAAARAEAVDPVVAPPAADVAISAGDVISITVIGETTLSHTATVTADGKVPMGLIGETKVAGMKPAEAAEAIRASLSRYLRDPQVTVDLVQANRASVYGRVLKPGTYVLPPNARAIDLIQMAGGFDEAADRASIRLLRKGMTIAVDLGKFAVTADPRFNPELQAGDTLNVPERPTLTIPVLGQVAKPGNVVMPPEATVMDAVQAAGGFAEHADREHVVVLRAGSQAMVDLMRVQGNGIGPDNPGLRPGDSVTVPEKRMLSVSVLGQVMKPSVYQMPEGSTAAEAVQMAGGLAEGADLSLARIIHRDQQTSEPLNLKGALENANGEANIKVHDGDTISIPKPAVDRKFGVLGAVKTPGYFAMDHDRVTVMEALSHAGGPDATANMARATIVHRDGEQVIRTSVDLRPYFSARKVKGQAAGAGIQPPTLGAGDVLYLDVKKDSPFSAGNMLGVLGMIPAIIWAVKGL